MRKQVAGVVAHALRAVANRLDPEPPHMKEALRLLGWRYDGTQWFYSDTHVWSTSSGTTTAPPFGTITWHMETGED